MNRRYRCLTLLPLLALGCSVSPKTHPCNIAVAAPLVTIDLRAYASTHHPVTTALCLTGDYSRAQPSCTTYTIDADGTGHRIAGPGGYAPLHHGGLQHGAPTGGATVSLTFNLARPAPTRTTLHVAGRPGYCGAWHYPTLTVGSSGQLAD